MNHDEFCRAWDAALRTAGLLTSADSPEDSVALATMTRTHRVLVGAFQKQPAEPFMGSLELSWQWDALLSARTRTTEEDALTELLGRQGAARLKTEQPWLRVDIKLHGKLAWDKPLLLASSETWRAWAADVTSKVDPRLPSDETSDPGIVHSWLGEPEAHVRVRPAGELWLLGVELAGWQAIDLPRKLDDPDAASDADPQAQMEALGERLVTALNAWKNSLRLLLPKGALLH